MSEHLRTLTDLNRAINAAENAGDVATLEQSLAPVFAFRRASGVLVDRVQFLTDAKPSGPRAIEVRSVDLLGRARALVRCAVSMPIEGKEKSFDNVRLFVRGEDGLWRLMAWANEPM